MALSPMTPMPIQWENVLVDIQPTSLAGADHDTAMINTTMQLSAPANEETIFVLPAADAPEQAPLIRVISESPGTAAEFEGADVEEITRKLLRDARRADMDFWEEVRKEAHGGLSFTRVRVRAGEQLVRFHYPQRIAREADGTFELRVLAPLASFLLNPSGGDISFSVALPRIPGRNIQLQTAVAENPPGTSTGDLTERPVLAQRQFVAHYLRQDPLYRIRYVYV